MKYVIEMPDGWDMADPCKDCPFECDSCTFPALNCPLGHAKKAVEVGYVDDKGAMFCGTPLKKYVKLFAVEDKP